MIICAEVAKAKDDVIIGEAVVITKEKIIWVLKITLQKVRAITVIIVALKVTGKMNVRHLSILSSCTKISIRTKKIKASSSNARVESYLTFKDDVQTGSSKRYGESVQTNLALKDDVFDGLDDITHLEPEDFFGDHSWRLIIELEINNAIVFLMSYLKFMYLSFFWLRFVLLIMYFFSYEEIKFLSL